MHNHLTVFLICLTLLEISCTEQYYTDPLSPEKALESFQLREGFTIEIFATEPQVSDPVELIFDEQGNAFVVEMPDYPFKPTPGKAAGRIKRLVDTDGDGRIDESILFADQLSEATSMLPWKGGLLVTTAPHILYLKDTNDDFRADTQEVLFSGFFENNSEAQITNLCFGVDNWIYAANNGQAGEVHFSRNPEAPALSMAGGDFRFRLDRGQFELASGPAQFGLTINDWGQRFITQNTLHIRHAVIPWRYMHRHSYLPSATAAVNISDHDLLMFQKTPPPYWRAERTRRRQQQYKEQGLDREEYAEDHFTGASGGTVYAGDAFPEEYYGNVFTGDVAGNLIHRDVLTPLDVSPTFVARRDAAEQDREFLASTDSWFRPVSFTVSPDGYLYVVDMYRQHIETPVSIPEDLKEDMDFLNGSDRGRIYRIVPENATPKENATPNLREKESEALVSLLAHPNQWWRLQAQRLLLERQDASVIPAVKSLFADHEDPRARLHALFVLEGLHALDATLVKQAMQDAHPGVRAYGVMLSEQYPECLPQLVESISDSSVQVAFQGSLSIGEFADQQAIAALAKVVEQHGEDAWFRTAVLSAETGSSMDLMEMLMHRGGFFQEVVPWKLTFLKDFAYVIGSRHEATAITAFLAALSGTELGKEEDWQKAGVTGLVSGLKKSDTEAKEALDNIESASDTDIGQAIEELKKLFAQSI